MKREIQILFSCISLIVLFGCSLDAKIDTGNNSYTEPEIKQVSVTPLVNGLNYPTSVRFINSDDPEGTGENSVLKKGNLLVANAGSSGNYANTVVQVDPKTQTFSLFSSHSQMDVFGISGVERPVSISFPGPYPWIANATWCFGSVSVLDASPGVGFDGPHSQAGEPIDGPTHNGVFGCSDFHLTVTSVIPALNATDVPLDSVIVVKFSLPVDPSTVNKDTLIISLDDADKPTDMNIQTGDLTGTYHFSADLMTVTFVPDQQLLSSTIYEPSVYEIEIKNDILDTNGNEFDANLNTPDDEEDYKSQFTTLTEHSAPRVLSIHPNNFAVVSQDAAIVLTFSEPIRQDSVDEHSLKLIKADYDGYYTEPELSFDKYYYDNNRILAIIPDSSDWVESSRYYVLLRGTLSTGYEGIQDRAGNGLDGDGDGAAGGDFWSSFWTDGADDPPYVISFSPAKGATNVPVTSTVDVVFSEPVYSGSITNRSFLLYWGDGQIPGIVSRSNGYITATFTPYQPLPYDARIDVILTAEIEDVEGNPLDGNNDGLGGDNFYSWFSTGTNPADYPPQVSIIQPADGQTDLPISTVISVTFTKEINPATVTTSSFFLTQAGTPYPATVTVLAGNMGATLSPISPLNYSTTYTVTLTDSITDLGGRHFDGDGDGNQGGNFVSSFTTMVDPGTVPVWVTNISPSEGQTGISVGTSVIVTFSRAINPSTIWTGNFYMFDSVDTVLGSINVAGDNQHATFTPDNPLSDNTLYTVQLLDTIQDTSGNALDGEHDGVAGGTFESNFTTGATLNLVINEFLPAPATDWDNGGTTSSTGDEWIEIYNNTAVAVNLDGMYLGDATNPTRFQFGTESLGAYSYRVVFGSEQGGLSLNNTGDTVFLVDTDGSTVIDSHTYSSSSSDASIQRVPDASANWEQSNSCAAPGGGGGGCPSPGETNSGAKNNSSESFSRYGHSLGESSSGTTSSDDRYKPLLLNNWGFGGLAYGGPAPDDGTDNNVQFFASHPNLNDIFVFDYDTGYYNLGGDIPQLIEKPGSLVFIPNNDENGNNSVGTGNLFVVLPQWDSVALFNILPTGPIGQYGTRVQADLTHPISFFPAIKNPSEPTMVNPIDIVYDDDTGHLFIANRGNGSVAEMDTDGNVMVLYKTNLGMDTVSALDIGTWGNGKKIVLATTGGPYINEQSGQQGALYYFEP